MVKITRIQIRDYRGVQALDLEVPPKGGVLSGENAAGKTSFLRAFSAALAGRGINASDIRIGADQSEIIVDMDAVRARRLITQNGSSLTVRTPENGDWSEPRNRPQQRLDELLGGAGVDALDILFAKKEERLRKIRAAMPATVTAEDFARWTDSDEAFDCSGHGQEAIARVRQTFYERRTKANAAAKEAERKAKDAEAAAEAVKADLDGPADVAAERQRAQEAERGAQDLESRQQSWKRAMDASEQTRRQIQGLRADAGTIRLSIARPTEEEITTVETEVAAAREALAAAQRRVAAAQKSVENQYEAIAAASRTEKEAADLERRAADLEKSLSSVDSLVVNPDDVAAAAGLLQLARESVEKAERAHAAREKARASAELRAKATEASDIAKDLDGIVGVLTSDAPRELAARSAMIPGLDLSGDDVVLNGVPLGSLSGAEEVAFCVEIAKRLNPNAGILLVDGLERIVGKRFEDFVRAATSSGWQLLGTRAREGETVFEALEIE